MNTLRLVIEDVEEYDCKDCRMSRGNYCHLLCVQQMVNDTLTAGRTYTASILSFDSSSLPKVAVPKA